MTRPYRPRIHARRPNPPKLTATEIGTLMDTIAMIQNDPYYHEHWTSRERSAHNRAYHKLYWSLYPEGRPDAEG